MDKRRFRRAVIESASRLVDKVLEQIPEPALVYDLQLVGTKSLLSVRSGGSLQEGSQIITFGEKLTELIGGEWRLDDQYRRVRVAEELQDAEQDAEAN